MTDGRRWFAVDADLFGKQFTHDLHDRFGPAGVCVWIAFLAACKRGRPPGRVRIMNTVQGMTELGIAGWDLVDPKGEPWDLDDFFAFTGRKKQTRRRPIHRRDARRTATGQCFDVDATHYGRWQDDARTYHKAEQMRTSRAQKRGKRIPRVGNTPGTNVVPDSDLDIDTPLSPPKGGQVALRAEDQGPPQDLRSGMTAVRNMLGKGEAS